MDWTDLENLISDLKTSENVNEEDIPKLDQLIEHVTTPHALNFFGNGSGNVLIARHYLRDAKAQEYILSQIKDFAAKVNQGGRYDKSGFRYRAFCTDRRHFHECIIEVLQQADTIRESNPELLDLCKCEADSELGDDARRAFQQGIYDELLRSPYDLSLLNLAVILCRMSENADERERYLSVLQDDLWCLNGDNRVKATIAALSQFDKNDSFKFPGDQAVIEFFQKVWADSANDAHLAGTRDVANFLGTAFATVACRNGHESLGTEALRTVYHLNFNAVSSSPKLQKVIDVAKALKPKAIAAVLG